MKADWPEIKKIWGLYAPFRRRVLPVFAFLLVYEILDLGGPYLMGHVVNLVYEQKPLVTIGLFLLLVVVVNTIRNVVNYLKDLYIYRQIEYKIDDHLKILTMRKLFSFSLGQHRSQNSNLTRTVINQGESNLRQIVDSLIYQAIPILLQMSVCIVAIFFIDWVVGLILLIGIGLSVYLGFYTNNRLKPRLKEGIDLSQDDDKLRGELFQCMSLILGNGQEEPVEQKYRDRINMTSGFLSALWIDYISWSLIRGFIIVLIRPTVVFVSAYHMYQGWYQVGSLVVLFMWSGHAMAHINWLPQFQRQLMRQWNLVTKYLGIFDVETSVPVPLNPVVIEDINEGIRIENVSFKYSESPYLPSEVKEGKIGEMVSHALHDINLEINAGEMVALVGPSGAGKSTLLSLLRREYDPTEGSIWIDDVNLRSVHKIEWARSIGSVDQEVLHFDDTLRSNILFGVNGHAQSVTDEELMKIAQIARIDQFLPRLPNGFDTIIGERGTKLSGGEGQRVAIARAIAKNPFLLTFDEATSHLDSINEKLITSAISDAVEGRTSVFIAHRLSTVRHADKIVVMDKGRIVATGKHHELLDTCSFYKELVNSQLL